MVLNHSSRPSFDSISGMPHDQLPLRSLVLNHSDGLLREMCCTTEVTACVDNSPGGLQIRFPNGVATHFYEFLSVPNLEKLTISSIGRAPNVNPWTVFGAPRLRVIHLCHNGLEDLLWALQPCPSGGIFIFAPALIEIVLESIKFPLYCVCSRCPPGRGGTNCLEDVLAKREKLGFRVYTLVINDWDEDARDKLDGFKCVDKVDFQGDQMEKPTMNVTDRPDIHDGDFISHCMSRSTGVPDTDQWRGMVNAAIWKM